MKEYMKKSISRLYNAWFYSMNGLRAMFASEQAFRQDLAVFIIGSVVLCFISATATQKAIMLLSLFLLLMAETANTAIETAIDRISEDKHPLSKKAKDIGSFLVLLAIFNLWATWIIILLF